MIKAITNFDDLTIYWKSTIQTQCELTNEQVRSLTSVRGQVLDKQTSDYVWQSLSRVDVLALFEINIDSSNPIMTADYEDDNILSYIYANLKIIIYGKSSSLIATKFKGRIESGEVRDLLWNNGINFDRISSIQTIQEFMNNTIYFRTDIDLNFSFRYDTSKITKDFVYKEDQESITDIITD